MLFGAHWASHEAHDIHNRLLSISHWIFNQLGPGQKEEKPTPPPQKKKEKKNHHNKEFSGNWGEKRNENVKMKNERNSTVRKRKKIKFRVSQSHSFHFKLYTVCALVSAWFVSQTTTKWAGPNSINTFRVRPPWLCVCVCVSAWAALSYSSNVCV